MTDSRRPVILKASQFLFYDRKEDEDLPRGVIEAAIAAGEVTIEEIGGMFTAGLRTAIKPAERGQRDAAGYPPGEGQWWPGCTDRP